MACKRNRSRGIHAAFRFKQRAEALRRYETICTHALQKFHNMGPSGTAKYEIHAGSVEKNTVSAGVISEAPGHPFHHWLSMHAVSNPKSKSDRVNSIPRWRSTNGVATYSHLGLQIQTCDFAHISRVHIGHIHGTCARIRRRRGASDTSGQSKCLLGCSLARASRPRRSVAVGGTTAGCCNAIRRLSPDFSDSAWRWEHPCGKVWNPVLQKNMHFDLTRPYFFAADALNRLPSIA